MLGVGSSSPQFSRRFHLPQSAAKTGHGQPPSSLSGRQDFSATSSRGASPRVFAHSRRRERKATPISYYR
ncbi:hypothetical protein SRHO_G00202830 [Serrasalmus rhombeus]